MKTFLLFCLTLPVIGFVQAQNVGIGTKSPISKLQVGDLSLPGPQSVYITVGSSGGNTSRSGIKFRHFSDKYGFTIESDDRIPSQGLNFLQHNNSVEGASVMFIGSNGNVGIGTVSPKAQLHTTGLVKHESLAGQGVRLVYATDDGTMTTNTVTDLPFTGSTSSTGIPDNGCQSESGAVNTITLSGLPNSIATSNLVITVNINHPQPNNLFIHLTAPNGEVINLFSPEVVQANGANLTNTVFSDGGSSIVNSAPPFTGNFKPSGGNYTYAECLFVPTVGQTFSSIGGGSINPNGKWTLTVFDRDEFYEGNLVNWGIDFLPSGNAAKGAQNYMPKWDGGALTGTSNIFDNGRYVGIGTTNPISKLHVQALKDTGAATFAVELDNIPAVKMIKMNEPAKSISFVPAGFEGPPYYSNTTFQAIDFSNSSIVGNHTTRFRNGSQYSFDSRMAIGAGYTGSGNTPQIMAPANGLAVEGKVGIGTPTPSNVLDVAGNVAIGKAYAGSQQIFIPTNSLAVEGRVGIGTPAPAYSLDVKGSMAVGLTYAGRGTVLGQPPAGSLLVEGNLGIGVQNPKYVLDIRKDLSYNGDIGDNSAQLSVGTATQNENKRMVMGYSRTGNDNNGFGYIMSGNYLQTLTPVVLQPAGGSVGIGTNGPSRNTLDITGRATGLWTQTDSYGMRLEVPNGGQGIFLKIKKNTINSNDAFITFGKGAGANFIKAGRIRGFNYADANDWAPPAIDDPSFVCYINGLLGGAIPTDPVGIALAPVMANLSAACKDQGVIYESSYGDYAEYLEKADSSEKMYPGDIVGVKGGKISKNTNGAEQIMSVSLAPVVLGNTPQDNLLHLFKKVGFMGQVPMKVKGRVKSGDYIIASGLNDGVGIPVSAEDLELDQIGRIAGRSWTTDASEGLKYINCVIGVKSFELSAILKKQQQHFNNMSETLEGVTGKLAKVDSENDQLKRLIYELSVKVKALETKVTVALPSKSSVNVQSKNN